MRGLNFPIIGTKTKRSKKHISQEKPKRQYDLNSPDGRKEYFEAKVGDEIDHIKKFLDKGSFIAYFLGKKFSGKGTYSKLLTEIFGEDKIAHVSVGDLIREADDWENFIKTRKYEKLKDYYRGYVSFKDAVDAHLSRSTKQLLPTEFILALLKAHIDDLQGKSIFIDGLPRDMDQISYSLYFRDLIAYREDQDFFVLIDIPESVIEERMKYRVVCPKCQTSRNRKLLVTSKIDYDKKKNVFYLRCDNKTCRGSRMVGKEGDDAGLDPIRARLEKDEKLIKTAFKLHGVPMILLRNNVPVNKADRYYDRYELTPEYSFSLGKGGKVKVSEDPWVIKDDGGVDSYSLLAPPVVVLFIKQLCEVLDH